MRTRDSLTLLGAFLLAVGPELQTEGGTPLEWKIGRYMRVVGAILLSGRALQKPQEADKKEP